MTETKEIEKLEDKVRTLVPSEWNVTQGFFLDMMNPRADSPGHVSVSRTVGLGADRKAWHKESRDLAPSLARVLRLKLGLKKFRVSVDGGTSYIIPR